MRSASATWGGCFQKSTQLLSTLSGISSLGQDQPQRVVGSGVVLIQVSGHRLPSALLRDFQLTELQMCDRAEIVGVREIVGIEIDHFITFIGEFQPIRFLESQGCQARVGRHKLGIGSKRFLVGCPRLFDLLALFVDGS